MKKYFLIVGLFFLVLTNKSYAATDLVTEMEFFAEARNQSSGAGNRKYEIANASSGAYYYHVIHEVQNDQNYTLKAKADSGVLLGYTKYTRVKYDDINGYTKYTTELANNLFDLYSGFTNNTLFYNSHDIYDKDNPTIILVNKQLFEGQSVNNVNISNMVIMNKMEKLYKTNYLFANASDYSYVLNGDSLPNLKVLKDSTLDPENKYSLKLAVDVNLKHNYESIYNLRQEFVYSISGEFTDLPTFLAENWETILAKYKELETLTGIKQKPKVQIWAYLIDSNGALIGVDTMGFFYLNGDYGFVVSEETEIENVTKLQTSIDTGNIGDLDSFFEWFNYAKNFIIQFLKVPFGIIQFMTDLFGAFPAWFLICMSFAMIIKVVKIFLG